MSQTSRRFDAAVVIGRFEPPHNAHFALFRQALAVADIIVVVLGSAFHARSPKNPFTADERGDLIMAGLDLPEAGRARVRFVPVRDYYGDDQWEAAVRAGVKAAVSDARSIALVGHIKDQSSNYLKGFSDWDKVMADKTEDIDATVIRDVYFEAESMDIALSVLRQTLPTGVVQYLRAWARLPYYADIKAEHAGLVAGKAAWAAAPYAPIFVTVDAVVETVGRVLLIRRGKAPGKGLLALPGGFVEQDETLLASCLRELREETRFGLLDDFMRTCLRASQVFDHPGRSQRGRTITHAFHFELDSRSLPEIEASDDAMKGSADWVPIDRLADLEDQFFDDHFHILNHFLGLRK